MRGIGLRGEGREGQEVEDEGLARGVTWRDVLMGSIDGVTQLLPLHCAEI